MTIVPLASRSRFNWRFAYLFLGGGSAVIWFQILTTPGGVEGFLEIYDGRRPAWLMLTAAVVMPLMLAWVAISTARRKTPPVYLEGSLLHAEGWIGPLDMAQVRAISIDEGGFNRSNIHFELVSGEHRTLSASMLRDAPHDIVAKLCERFDLPLPWHQTDKHG